MRTRRLLWFGIPVIAICALLGGIYGSRVEANDPDPGDSSLQVSMKQFTRIYGIVQKNYADPVKPNESIFGPSSSTIVGAIPGMLRTLDPHSNFFGPKAFQALREDQEGRYFGVGMVISQRLNQFNKLVTVVVYPFHGSPAMRAGVRAGDVIVKINGESAEGFSTDKVASLLKGPKGTKVNFSVARLGVPGELKFTITRAAISQHSVETAFMVRPGIGYIRLTKFDETTDPELTAALNRMDASHMRGLILDLRGNPGGLLQEAVEVADHFLARNQLIVYHYGRNSREHRYYAVNGNQGYDYPMVVLIGPNTASAAEIVTGALQDHDRALVIGQPSFGKGLVQTVYPLSDHTGLALTTAHYYTPSGRLIQRNYSNLSLYDYFNHQDEPSPPRDHVYLTDGGRKVYGGGGITPDVLVSEMKLNGVQQKLLSHSAFFNFGKEYIEAHPDVPKSFTAAATVIAEFKSYLKKAKIDLSEKEFAENREYIEQQIRQDILGAEYGQVMADRISVEDSPLVQKAVDEMPEAAELMTNAKLYMASREHGH
ncbi:MAG: S41 family peptidase [Acidobacteriota bacterium]|nr:S41 family peptidase [Acidobacteriota bacterium]